VRATVANKVCADRTLSANSDMDLEFVGRLVGFESAQKENSRATVEPTCEIRLLEPVPVTSRTRALVTVLDEAPNAQETALLNKAALAEDWNHAEEDGAWVYLQPGKS